ncbi:unnamed protein product [Rhizophagus irregularis]|nr:unnamed protein product [Rhizophagus irregularis]
MDYPNNKNGRFILVMHNSENYYIKERGDTADGEDQDQGENEEKDLITPIKLTVKIEVDHVFCITTVSIEELIENLNKIE